MSNAEIWVIDDDRSIRWVLEKALNREGVAVRVFDSGVAALRCLQDGPPAVVLSDARSDPALGSDKPRHRVVIRTYSPGTG